jgi:hypothetical protein
VLVARPTREKLGEIADDLKAGITPKVISERIGHADVGFFLQTYAHVLRNDDRDAAEQAAAFLIGNTWGPGDEDES